MNKLSFSLYVECCFCSIQHRAMSRSGVQGPEQAAFFLGPWLNCCNVRDERDLRFASPRSLSHREVRSAVGCCGQPPCVAVATAQCRLPTAQHSTAPLTFTSLLSLSLAAAGVGSPGPRLHAHHRAAPGAPWRREAHRRAVRSSRGAVPAPPHHSHAPHAGTTLTTFTTFSLSLGRCTVGTQWMVLLLVGAVDGSISRIRSIRNMQASLVKKDLKWPELYLL